MTVALRPPAVALTREWSYRLYQRPWGKYALVLTAPRRRIGETSSASPARAAHISLRDKVPDVESGTFQVPLWVGHTKETQISCRRRLMQKVPF